MRVRNFSTLVEDLLRRADIRINGDRPWDMQVHDRSVFGRILRQGSLGLGESYMDGQWDAERVDQFIERILRARLDRDVRPLVARMAELRMRWLNLQTRHRAREVAETHYDLGNDLYQAMLDPYMAYSCGYWRNARSLDEAQVAKLELICRKLRLRSGMRVLDIGCGWGSFARYAAERHGVEVVGINISDQQIAWARERCRGLPVEIRKQDYREIDEPFDAIVSVGMFEHVGHRNYRRYFEVAERCLPDGGLFLLHTIGTSRPEEGMDPWIERYIFPNSELPSLAQITEAVYELLVVEDVHNFGADYDRTLMAWHANFEAAWPAFRDRYGERFHRMWRYYLLSCAGAFRARVTQLWQIVLSKGGVPGGYRRPDL